MHLESTVYLCKNTCSSSYHPFITTNLSLLLVDPYMYALRPFNLVVYQENDIQHLLMITIRPSFFLPFLHKHSLTSLTQTNHFSSCISNMLEIR